MNMLDIDREDTLNACLGTLQDITTQNFVVQFDANQAKCGINLTAETVTSILSKSPEASGGQTTWINFWGWDSQQTEVVEAIANRYHLSPRLLDVLWPSNSPQSSHSPQMADRSHGIPAAATVPPNGVVPGPAEAVDLEKGVRSMTSPNTVPQPTTRVVNQVMPTFRQVVDELWHFCSVDWGEHYLYVGYNALFVTEESKENTLSDKPSGQRIWTSLLLCDDGTVVSIFEIPESASSVPLSMSTIRTLRRNVLNVFRHLSKVPQAHALGRSLMRVTIRPYAQANGDLPSSRNGSRNEPASLLFYYLFDDWLTSYALIARREHPYRKTLEEIRQRMFLFASVDSIESLHLVGRQLTVLKLMYQSYELIVLRILQRRLSAKDSLFQSGADTHLGLNSRHSSVEGSLMQHAADSAYDAMVPENRIEHKVSLPLSAAFRFERLLDRIRLLAQTEIQQCIEEKESLTFMNFNLVSLKESQAVEKLTRTTIFLAKATIMFLPVSLMTAYFSIQIGDIAHIYSLKTYWLCFLAVIVLSAGILFGYGLISGTVEGKTVYKSMTRMVWEKEWTGKRKMKAG